MESNRSGHPPSWILKGLKSRMAGGRFGEFRGGNRIYLLAFLENSVVTNSS